MKATPLLRQLFLAAACLPAFPVTCNSIFEKPRTQLAGNEGWEYVTPVGTNIPQRVVKGQQPVLPSPTTTMSQEAWVQAMHKAQGTVNAPPGRR